MIGRWRFATTRGEKLCSARNLAWKVLSFHIILTTPLLIIWGMILLRFIITSLVQVLSFLILKGFHGTTRNVDRWICCTRSSVSPGIDDNKHDLVTAYSKKKKKFQALLEEPGTFRMLLRTLQRILFSLYNIWLRFIVSFLARLVLVISTKKCSHYCVHRREESGTKYFSFRNATRNHVHLFRAKVNALTENER